MHNSEQLKLDFNDSQEFIAKDLDSGQQIDIRSSNNFSYLDIENQSIWQDYWKNQQEIQTQFWDYCELNLEDKLKTLLKFNVIDINKKLFNNLTALHLSVEQGHLNICKILINNQIDINLLTKNQQTCLHLSSIKGFSQISQLLIECNININQQDFENNTALHYASENGYFEVVEIILQNKLTNYHLKNNKQLTAQQLSQNIKVFQVFQNYCQNKEENQGYQKTILFNQLLNNSRIDHVNRCLFQCKIERYKNLKQRSKIIQSQEQIKLNNKKYNVDDFQVNNLLGKGSFGQVFLVTLKIDKSKQYAMKSLKKSQIQKDKILNYAIQERNVLSFLQQIQGMLSNPFLVKLNFAFQNKTHFFLVMEYVPGGTINNLLKQQYRLNEEQAKFYICEILLGLQYLHEKNIIYRDLKPDNILLTIDGHIKLTDFGLAKQMKNNELSKSFCGSIAYLAPEILNRSGHNKTLDYYTLGVLLYEFLTGLPPYYNQDKKKLFSNILNQKLKLPQDISLQCQDLLLKLLSKKLDQRLGSKFGVSEIKQHIWFKNIDWDLVYDQEYPPPFTFSKQQSNQNAFAQSLFKSKINKEKENKKNQLDDWTFLE